MDFRIGEKIRRQKKDHFRGKKRVFRFGENGVFAGRLKKNR